MHGHIVGAHAYQPLGGLRSGFLQMCGTVLPLCAARKIDHCELVNYKDSWSCGNSGAVVTEVRVVQAVGLVPIIPPSSLQVLLSSSDP